MTPAPPSIFAYLEGTPDARRLLDVGRKSLETGKPVMIWKAATTDAGIKAAASHTANMTGSYDLYRAALRQSGLIEVDDVEPIVDIAKLFAQGRLPKGNAVGVLSISGGSGIVYADAAVRGGMTLPPFSDATLAALRRIVPSFGSPENPADVTASFFNDMTLFSNALEIVLADPRLDQLSILLASISGPSAARAATAIAAVASKTDKPLHVAWSGRQAKSPEALAGAHRGGRAVRHHAGAAGARRRDPRPLCRRPAPPAAAPGARGDQPQGLRAAGRRRDAQRGGEQGGADRVRHPHCQRGVRCCRRRCDCRGERIERTVRGEDRLPRHRPQDGSRRREARRRP